MQFRTLKTATALLAASVGVSAFAGSAQATVFQNQYFYLDRDPAGEVSLMNGNVANDWSHSTISPHVTGTFKVVNGDDANFRVRVDSRDIHNTAIGLDRPARRRADRQPGRLARDSGRPGGGAPAARWCSPVAGDGCTVEDS